MALSGAGDALEAAEKASSLNNKPATRKFFPVVIALAAVSQGILFGFSLGFTSPALAPLAMDIGLSTLQVRGEVAVVMAAQALPWPVRWQRKP